MYHNTTEQNVQRMFKYKECLSRLLGKYWTSNYYYYIRLIAFSSMTTWVSQHQKGKPFWILLEQEMMGWQWQQLDHMKIICTALQTDNHASTSPLSFYRPDAFPATQPTASKHWRQDTEHVNKGKIHIGDATNTSDITRQQPSISSPASKKIKGLFPDFQGLFKD